MNVVAIRGMDIEEMGGSNDVTTWECSYNAHSLNKNIRASNKINGSEWAKLYQEGKYTHDVA